MNNVADISYGVLPGPSGRIIASLFPSVVFHKIVRTNSLVAFESIVQRGVQTYHWSIQLPIPGSWYDGRSDIYYIIDGLKVEEAVRLGVPNIEQYLDVDLIIWLSKVGVD